MNLAANYPLLCRQAGDSIKYGFSYQSIDFTQESFTIFAGLNAVDNKANVDRTFSSLKANGINCARMGVYKPRTSPYSFQGLGIDCLAYIFELAGKYAIKIIAMELTHDRQIEQVDQALELAGRPTGVMIQIGTRNAQNFELLKAVGSQYTYPILFKRGYGISLEESIAACEYLAVAGNNKIIFCLRGMKSQYASPHRNFVDFSHVPVIHRLTKLPVCIDPSHAIGDLSTDLNLIPDIFSVNAQGIIAGANMLLIDIHPNPQQALVDAKQAISLNNLGWLIDDIYLCRQAYLKRLSLAARIAEISTTV